MCSQPPIPLDLETPQTVVLETVDELIVGPLDEVLRNLAELKTRYETDYTALALDGYIEVDPTDGSPFVVAELTGIPAYSEATKAKLDQVKILLLSLPVEAASSFIAAAQSKP